MDTPTNEIIPGGRPTFALADVVDHAGRLIFRFGAMKSFLDFPPRRATLLRVVGSSSSIAAVQTAAGL